MQWENTFHTFTVRNTANSEVFVDSATLASNHDTRIDLHTLFITLDHAGVDFNCITDLERGDLGLELFGFDFS